MVETYHPNMNKTSDEVDHQHAYSAMAFEVLSVTILLNDYSIIRLFFPMEFHLQEVKDEGAVP